MTNMAHKESERPPAKRRVRAVEPMPQPTNEGGGAAIAPATITDAATYDALTKERLDGGDPSTMTLMGLITYATGTTEWDLVLALLQEIEMRALTLRAAVDAERSELEWRHLDMELYMLSRKAEVAQELLSRRAGSWHQPAPFATARRRARDEELSHAAEE